MKETENEDPLVNNKLSKLLDTLKQKGAPLEAKTRSASEAVRFSLYESTDWDTVLLLLSYGVNELRPLYFYTPREAKEHEVIGKTMLSTLRELLDKEPLLVKPLVTFDRTDIFTPTDHVANIERKRRDIQALPAKYQKYFDSDVQNMFDLVEEHYMEQAKALEAKRPLDALQSPSLVSFWNKRLFKLTDTTGSDNYLSRINDLCIYPSPSDNKNFATMIEIPDNLIGKIISLQELGNISPNLLTRKQGAVSLANIIATTDPTIAAKQVLKYGQGMRFGDVLQQNIFSNLFFTVPTNYDRKVSSDLQHPEITKKVYDAQAEILDKVLSPAVAGTLPDSSFDKLFEQMLTNANDDTLLLISATIYHGSTYFADARQLFHPAFPLEHWRAIYPFYEKMTDEPFREVPPAIRQAIPGYYNAQFFQEHMDEISANFRGRFHGEATEFFLQNMRSLYALNQPDKRGVQISKFLDQQLEALSPDQRSIFFSANGTLIDSQADPDDPGWYSGSDDEWTEQWYTTRPLSPLQNLGIASILCFSHPSKTNRYVCINILNQEEQVPVIIKLSQEQGELDILEYSFSTDNEKYKQLLERIAACALQDISKQGNKRLAHVEGDNTQEASLFQRSSTQDVQTSFTDQEAGIDEAALAFLKEYGELSYKALREHDREDLAERIKQTHEGIDTLRTRLEAQQEAALSTINADNVLDQLIARLPS